MIDIVERLRFDATRCEMHFSKGVASNIDDAASEIERLRAALKPFALRPGAVSLSGALGHITREDLLRASDAYEQAVRNEK